jgi:hypothetical protein
VIIVQQSLEENPLTFLQHIKDTIRKDTTVEPESQVGEVLLKVKILTQSAPDICRKLQKSVAEGEKSLDQLMQLAMSVYYNHDVTKKREKDKSHHDLIVAIRECPTQLEPTSQACYHCGQKGHFHRECLKGGQSRRKPQPPPRPCPLCKGTTGGLSPPVSRWKVRCHLLWIDGSWGLLSRLHFLASVRRALG